MRSIGTKENYLSGDIQENNILTAEEINSLVSELSNIIADAGFELSESSTTQILESINLKISNAISTNENIILNTNHRHNLENPHQVSKSQVGLGNVDNTSDIDKPISSATQSVLDEIRQQADRAIDMINSIGDLQPIVFLTATEGQTVFNLPNKEVKLITRGGLIGDYFESRDDTTITIKPNIAKAGDEFGFLIST